MKTRYADVVTFFQILIFCIKESCFRNILNMKVMASIQKNVGKLNLNKTPAKAFTPPAKRKWAQGQAGL